MTNVAIYANDKPLSQKTADSLRQKISHSSIQEVGMGETPDYILTIGGDGTLLSAFHDFKYALTHAKFIGIHTGHLGFYTDWLPAQLDQLVDALESNQAQVREYPLVEVTMSQTNQELERHLALNECAVRSMTGTMVGQVYINGQYFETFRGDGVCVSTPTGSTGLNKSLGGAVLDPSIEAIQLTEMASLNSRVYRTLQSPIIIPKGGLIEVVPQQTQHLYLLTMDNKVIHSDKLEKIQFAVAEQRIKFAAFRHQAFWDRVQTSFIGKDLSCHENLNNEQ